MGIVDLPTFNAQQERSKETEKRILSALENLLEERSIDEISMKEISEASGVSIGGIYGRFPSKETALEQLHRDYEKATEEELVFEMLKAAGSDWSLKARLSFFSLTIVHFLKSKKGVLRTYLVRHWSNPKMVDGKTRERVEAVYSSARALILGAIDEDWHVMATPLVTSSLSMMITFAREHVVLKPQGIAGGLKVDEIGLANLMTRYTYAFLKSELNELGCTFDNSRY